MSKAKAERYDEIETEQRREAALKRMLSTPHKPHKPHKPIGKKNLSRNTPQWSS
jgi:hypothetical protein